jgi:hypothetical protein
MRLIDQINSDDLSYEGYKNILERSTSNISFFGAKYITVEGSTGSVSMGTLVNKVVLFVRKDWDFSMQQRAHGKIIASRITTLFGELNDKMKNANFLTRFFSYIREYFSDPEYEWNSWGQHSFELYTLNQLRRDLPAATVPARPQWMCTGQPDRYHEDAIFRRNRTITYRTTITNNTDI